MKQSTNKENQESTSLDMVLLFAMPAVIAALTFAIYVLAKELIAT